ncbi:uncharacterized protein [Amphiura filiformis]|uniref:uncharacterized protein n=1 Tax=Amphiura filiformis TaxID=82378 RepID=UPI003B2138DE
MAAPLARLVKKGVHLTTIINSVRHYGIKHQTLLQHRFQPVCSQHMRIAGDSLATRLSRQCIIGSPGSRPFSSLTSHTGTSIAPTTVSCYPQSSQLLQPTIRFLVQPKRTIIRYSLGKGKKKTVKAVVSRFYRFNSGLWLRCRAGRSKGLWKKSLKRRKRLKPFVFCSGPQSKKLDLMVTAYWRRQKNIPDDPLAPFENRNWFGYKEYPGRRQVNKMYEKGLPINMPYNKKQF